MKKALSFMLIGACTYGIFTALTNNSSLVCKHLKRMKKCGMEACNKIKAMF